MNIFATFTDEQLEALTFVFATSGRPDAETQTELLQQVNSVGDQLQEEWDKRFMPADCQPSVCQPSVCQPSACGGCCESRCG